MKTVVKGKNVNVEPGHPNPLGATWDGSGVNFAIFSEYATEVELCLFESPEDRAESFRIVLPGRSDKIWHGYFPDLRPGQLYGFRIHGPYDPQAGQRFNPYKIVLDPYAKGIGRNLSWNNALFGYPIGDPKGDLSFDERDSAPYAPLATVVDGAFEWGDDRNPYTPWNETILYELHVKGFTQLHPKVPPKLRGTYAGLATGPALRHLKELGITAVELMPIHHHLDEERLVAQKKVNYWGYNTLTFFAPDTRYAASKAPEGAVHEFKEMVLALHATGIEVILDVVYNHSAEGNHLGPTLSFRGIDNLSYYRLKKDDLRLYEDLTGCGNTLNMRHPHVIQLVMGSLRYWVHEMHVDGFRFDLAAVLAREEDGRNTLSAFLDSVRKDPVLSQVKLIAEPWDLGEGGYRLGKFPQGWAEWNDQYRNTIRRFWRGDRGAVPQVATRLGGSQDLYGENDRGPCASVNFITCHDGFTLQDLVSFNERQNALNGENNTDGESRNFSWNCGEEGISSNKKINLLRERQKRNFVATLLLSLGVPMIRAGDELSKTQEGNNNAYCQDNETSWLSWNLTREQKMFLEFFRWVIQFRKGHPVFYRETFFKGAPVEEVGLKDVTWLDSSGREMTEEDWKNPESLFLGALFTGENPEEAFLFLQNASPDPIPFTVPTEKLNGNLEVLLDTSEARKRNEVFRRGPYPLNAHALVLFGVRKKSG